MYLVHLGGLARGESRDVTLEIPADAPLWEDSGIRFGEPVRLDLQVTSTGTGQVLVRGTARTRTLGECRRCLEAVERELEMELALVWAPPDPIFGDEDGSDDAYRTLPEGAMDLDVGEAVREELILAAPLWNVCRETCRGICPECGADRNEQECHCAREEVDPRWSALKGLETD